MESPLGDEGLNTPQLHSRQTVCIAVCSLNAIKGSAAGTGSADLLDADNSPVCIMRKVSSALPRSHPSFKVILVVAVARVFNYKVALRKRPKRRCVSVSFLVS